MSKWECDKCYRKNYSLKPIRRVSTHVPIMDFDSLWKVSWIKSYDSNTYACAIHKGQNPHWWLIIHLTQCVWFDLWTYFGLLSDNGEKSSSVVLSLLITSCFSSFAPFLYRFWSSLRKLCNHDCWMFRHIKMLEMKLIDLIVMCSNEKFKVGCFCSPICLCNLPLSSITNRLFLISFSIKYVFCHIKLIKCQINNP